MNTVSRKMIKMRVLQSYFSVSEGDRMCVANRGWLQNFHNAAASDNIGGHTTMTRPDLLTTLAKLSILKGF